MKELRSGVGRLWSFVQLITLNFIKNQRKANQESITTTKPREYKMKSFGGFKRKILLDKTDLPISMQATSQSWFTCSFYSRNVLEIGMSPWPTHNEEDQLEARSIPGSQLITRSPTLTSFHRHLFWTTKTFPWEMQALLSVKLLELQGNPIWTCSASPAVMWWDRSGHADYINRVLSCPGGTPQACDETGVVTPTTSTGYYHVLGAHHRHVMRQEWSRRLHQQGISMSWGHTTGRWSAHYGHPTLSEEENLSPHKPQGGGWVRSNE